MVSIDTTQEKIVEASAKIIKMAIAKPETSFQQEVVQVWQSLVEQHDKPLPLVYLANDLIQRSKIKGTTEFWTLFKPALAPVFQKLLLKATAIDSQGIIKVIEVWKNRQVYDADFLVTLQQPIQSVEDVEEPSTFIRKSDLPESHSQLLMT